MGRGPSASHIQHFLRSLKPGLQPGHRLHQRWYSTPHRVGLPENPAMRSPPPAIPTCAPPTCDCARMPEGLDIDHKKPLIGTVPRYARHVVIRTGRDDWSSKIEDEEASVQVPEDTEKKERQGNSGINFAKALKALVGPGGKYHDPYRSIMITNSSLPTLNESPSFLAVDVFPANLLVPKIPNMQEGHEAFVRQYLLDSSNSTRSREHKSYGFLAKFLTYSPVPNSEHSAPKELVDIDESSLLGLDGGRKYKRVGWQVTNVPTVLICGHNSRDTRCGILGPILRNQFKQCIEAAHTSPATLETRVRIALTSHVGGHAWAGNVIIYIPPEWRLWSGEESPLAGMGIWYGRVEPRHVEGIVNETFTRGRVIEELLRGTVP